MILRAFRRSAPAKTARPTEDSRIYAVGDVHGCFDLWRLLKAKILDDAAQANRPRNVVVLLGDIVDRGPDSCAMVEELCGDPLPGFEILCLKGNHEDYLLRFLDDLSVAPSWLTYGGLATMRSYGIDVPDDYHRDLPIEALQAEWRERLPDHHRDFLRGLKEIHVEGDFAFVHAGVRPGIPLELQSSEDLLWIRGPFLNSGEDFGKVIVHGHTISNAPEFRANRIGIDTGAFVTGRLSCLVLDADERRIIEA
ncbi:metallophosphoesterase family protein [Oceanibacterium hippocampi]|uniref:Diadenosine tetraphosphatase n=1 Tax=Oceanibacterium hippocampi TaxID=745714 RepID=A0A1Y5TZW6_9PROT|nr:metallophosphoesterase family protein [Oceanibacterium hippocampi]SLN77733.1 diadenosine tetraphosphatase [Oceanibacterium hippocampi]